MSESKPSKKHMRSMGAHPEMRPAEEIGLDGIHPIEVIKGRKPLMTGAGLFDSNESIENKTPILDEARLSLEPRKLRFLPGTRLYYLTRDSDNNPIIPRSEIEEDRLFDRQLQVPTDLDVPAEYLLQGKRGQTTTKKVGQSQFGAFTVVLLPIRQDNGELKLVERLVSYHTRSKKHNS